MRKSLFYVIFACLFAACSAPKYTYYFDHYDYQAGKKAAQASATTVPTAHVEEAVEVEIEPLRLDESTLVASADEHHVVISKPKIRPSEPVEEVMKVDEAPAKRYKDMSRSEKRAFRKEAKQLMRSYIEAKKEGNDVKAAEATKMMDNDLKMAAIFGAVGLVALLIGGDVFWIIGGISLIIGVVFFVLWLSRQ